MDQVSMEDPAFTEDEDEDDVENAEAGKKTFCEGPTHVQPWPNMSYPLYNFILRDNELQQQMPVS